jgi:hypothetical protein
MRKRAVHERGSYQTDVRKLAYSDGRIGLCVALLGSSLPLCRCFSSEAPDVSVGLPARQFSCSLGPTWSISFKSENQGAAHNEANVLHLIGLGHSHLQTVADAWKQFAKPIGDIQLSTFQILGQRYHPLRNLVGGQFVFNPSLVSDLNQAAAIGDTRFFMFTGGSEHVRWGLVNDPRPFDCVTPSNATATEPLCGEVFPYEMLVALGQSAAEFLTVSLSLLRSLTDKPIYQLCPPPPLKGVDLARVKVGSIFEDGAKQYGIAPDALRVRIWQICIEGLRRACREKGVVFLEPPETMIDTDGCLVSEAVGHDAVHASAAYGRLLLEQLISL